MKTLLLACSILLLSGCYSKNKNAKAPAKNVVASLAVAPSISNEEIKKYHDAIENFLNHSLYKTNFNGSVLVAKNGVIVYEKYTGYKDLRIKDSLTAATPLQIASTSKTLTSCAILKLAQEGKLDLNAPINQFFPEMPYPGVTVKMLLEHRSGLPNYLHYMDNMGWNKRKVATNQDVINTLIQWHPQLDSRPGTHFSYCNTNFVLLASIVEKITGLSFPQYMKENIFEPSGMTDTYVRTQLDSVKSANSFQWNGALWPLDFTDGPYGDKNVYSTPRDLLKWDQALYDTAILSKQTLDSAFTPYSNEKKSMHNYGWGWRLYYYPNGKKVIYHNGQWHGFNSAFDRLTDEKVTIIILGNRFNKNIYTTAKKMYNLFGHYDGTGEDEGGE